jgi:hypothetical protein
MDIVNIRGQPVLNHSAHQPMQRVRHAGTLTKEVAFVRRQPAVSHQD